MESGKFKIDAKNGVVVYSLISKGDKFVGVAKTAPGDTFDENVGKAIAGRRVDIAVRRRDLEQVREVKHQLRTLVNTQLYYGVPKCKLYMVYYNDACEVEKRHLEKLRILKNELKCLEKGLPIPERVFNEDWPKEKVYKSYSSKMN